MHIKLMFAEGVRLLREKCVKGDPTGAVRRGGSRDHPRKANTFRKHQRLVILEFTIFSHESTFSIQCDVCHRTFKLAGLQ